MQLGSASLICSSRLSAVLQTPIIIIKTVSWDYDECILRTFRIQGTCKPCVSTGIDVNQSFVVNVVACSVNEAFTKLSNRNFIRSVKSVEVFNAPVNISDPLLDPALDFYSLIDVTPSLANCQASCPFLIDEDHVVFIKTIDAAAICYAYPMSGIIHPTNQFTPTSSSYYYGISGIITLGGGIHPNTDLGTIALVGKVIDIGEQIGVHFSDSAAVSAVSVVARISTSCSITVPAFLLLKHSLNSVLSLSRFLLYNGLTLPTQLSLQYKTRTGSWQTNLHFSGLSAEYNGTENWNVLFELTNDSNSWQFIMFIAKTDVGKTFIAKMVSIFGNDVFCSSGSKFNGFNFTFDLMKQTTIPASLSQSSFYDNNRLFMSSPIFISKPQLSFQIAVPNVGRSLTTNFSLESPRQVSVHVADNSI